MDSKNLIERINSLKKEKNAVILVHNYQRPEIYEIADFIGDSLDLSRKAAETKADIIVFCGVRFMVETAKILSPEKTVLLPDIEAGCEMADMVMAEEVKALKERFPNVPVVCYVNTTAEVKAESDVCCTSANAVKVVNSIPGKDVIFVPDRNLGRYAGSQTKKNMMLADGYCYVHDGIKAEDILRAKKEHPDAKVVAHPECTEDVLKLADSVQSTGGMIKYAKESGSGEFIIVTEVGMAKRLKREFPEKKFYPVGKTCINMKKITLEKVLASLEKEQFKVEVEESVRIRARKSLDRMLER
ncbi:MAG: quinolinate synthase NadA [Candidatus Aenigmarchaeota archaeon]|nr:quinolinate synthase NadA [Candidatus Aenigmarchaeota archaeon]